MPLPVFSPSKLPTPKPSPSLSSSTGGSSVARRSVAHPPPSPPSTDAGATSSPTPRAGSSTPASRSGSRPGSTGRRVSGESVRSMATTSEAPSIASRRERGKDADDKARMPPPPVPSSGSATSSRLRVKSTRDQEPEKPKEKEKKSSGLGRVGSVLKRSGTTSGKDKDKEKEKGKEKGTLSLGKTEEKNKGMGFMGRLRAGKSSSAAAAAEKEKEKEKEKESKLDRKPSVSTRAASVRSRPTSMVAPSSGPQAVNRRAPTGAERPTTSASSATLSSRTSTVASTSSHRRNPSITSTHQAAPAPSARPTTTTTKSKRPAFSTLTQSFTPQRPASQPPPPKPHPSAPPDPATVHAQTQLLQYTLLYASSHATYAQLTASATAKLQHRFETLARKHQETRRKLTMRQRRANLAGLKSVVETPALGTVALKRRDTIRAPEEKIQRFSEAISRLEALMQNEQRALTRAFEDWIEGYAPPSHHAPTDLTTYDNGMQGYIKSREKWIQGLGEAWRRECTRVGRGIEESVDDIQAVVAAIMNAGADADSGVVSVVAERWLDVARGMWEEVEGMWRVEESVVGKERERVSELAKEVVRDCRLDVEGAREEEWNNRRGIWA